MDEATMMWMEIPFDLLYLGLLWTLVLRMSPRAAACSDVPIGRLLRSAFLLLALGDTLHLGLRILAYALGGLEARPVVLGVEIPIVGWGALATSITVTFFYLIFLEIWRRRYNRERTLLYYGLVGIVVVRLVIFLFPGNQWAQAVPPLTWALGRNVPLTLLGIGVAALIWRDATAARDRGFVWISYMIFLSYGAMILFFSLYTFFPPIGMMMMVKTIAYVAMAFIGYHSLWGTRSRQSR